MKKTRYILIAVGTATILAAAALGFRLASTPCMPQTYAKLTSLPAEKLEQLDIALLNLLCAEGLPGAENLNVAECLAVLDRWAEVVKQSEQKYSVQFFENRQKYDNSYAMFQAVNLGLTLKEDLKCGYNQELVRSGAMEDIRSTRFFRNSSDLFLHGFVESRTGSCSSLPVLMVAVGRRCGYPLYLVACKGHLFCRWDDGAERFNIETACPGVDSKPDDYYRNWPYPSSDSEIRTEGYLQNLTPKQELAVFAQLRASCLQENCRLDESLEAYSLALEGFPLSTHLKAYIDNIHRRNSK